MLLPEISPTAGANSDGVLLGSVLQSLFTGTFNSAQMADSAHAYRKDSASGSASFTDISAAVISGTPNAFEPFGPTATFSAGDSLYVADSHVVQELFAAADLPGVWAGAGLEIRDSTDGKTANRILANVTDASNGFRNAAGVYRVTWDQPATARVAFSPVPGEITERPWLEIRPKNLTGVTTAPKLSRIWLSHTPDSPVYSEPTSVHNAALTDGSFSTGTQLFPVVSSVQALTVAGGGGGGYAANNGRPSGGGGAGGMRTAAALAMANQSYVIAVGAGGAGGTTGTGNGSNGGPSSIGALLSTVGGGGGGSNNANGSVVGSVGGSGGGGKAGSPAGAGGAGTAGEGSAGGASNTDNSGGGGGGAGGVGGNATTGPQVGGAGGTGSTSSITGTALDYAGGGGGGSLSASSGTAGTGGSGGGGNGSATGVGAAGTDGLGGGGGGSSSAAVVGGAGGSGIVITRFATQTRTYQALTSYADNAAAVAAGKLIGQFFRLTATGAVMQVT